MSYLDRSSFGMRVQARKTNRKVQGVSESGSFESSLLVRQGKVAMEGELRKNLSWIHDG